MNAPINRYTLICDTIKICERMLQHAKLMDNKQPNAAFVLMRDNVRWCTGRTRICDSI